MTIYEVTYGPRLGKSYRTLVEALRFAVTVAKGLPSGICPIVWEDSAIVVAVVIDDANGLTCHRLKDAAWVDDEEAEVWNLIGAVPRLGASDPTPAQDIVSGEGQP
jgi:hypothetical protein